MTTGYIGLGMMGAAMTRRLTSLGQAPVVFDTDSAAMARAAELGAQTATSSAEVAVLSEVISICVPAAAHVDSVVSGAGGLATAETLEGRTVLIHSTVDPATMVRSRDALAGQGATVHDACVAGGDEAAADGEIAMFVGGLEQMLPAGRAALDCYSSKVIDAGPVGAGAALKIGVNVMTYAQQVAAATAFDVVESAGGDTDALVEAWRHIGQLGALTERFLPMLGIAPEHITGDFRAGIEHTVNNIMCKDLALAAELGADGPRGLGEVPEVLGRVLPRVFNLERRR